ncbi:MAG TPA: DinB family protein [Bacteroidia bacterium]|nr:DinB family protein [Bacteroidia bacterium]
MFIHKPSPAELSDYYKTYLKYVPEDDLLSALKEQQSTMQSFFNDVSPVKESFRYADGKWMLKEVAGHLCDTERILSYRALRIARNDKLPLHGFDENEYTLNANYGTRSLKNILEEIIAIRQVTILLFQNMNEEMLDRNGTANNSEVSVRGLLFFIVAHARHHMGVIQERYLK